MHSKLKIREEKMEHSVLITRCPIGQVRLKAIESRIWIGLIPEL